MECKLYCDRVEENIAVLLDGNDKVYEVAAALIPEGIKEGAHYLCTIEDGVIVRALPAEHPLAGENKSRLMSLFRKSKRK